jgi:hypothetical protein
LHVQVLVEHAMAEALRSRCTALGRDRRAEFFDLDATPDQLVAGIGLEYTVRTDPVLNRTSELFAGRAGLDVDAKVRYRLSRVRRRGTPTSLAPLGRCHSRAGVVIGRKDPVKAGEVYSRFGYQGSQPGNKIERPEHCATLSITNFTDDLGIERLETYLDRTLLLKRLAQSPHCLVESGMVAIQSVEAGRFQKHHLHVIRARLITYVGDCHVTIDLAFCVILFS